jgi:hypothetical protein
MARGSFMNKNKILSWFFVIAGLIIMLGSIFVLVSYATDILNAVVDFITTNDLKKLAQCGASLPPQFAKIKADFTTLILPMLYYGVPVLLLVVSVLMFTAGYFYHKGRSEDEARKKEDIERDMIRKAAERVARQKAKEAEEIASKAMEEELEKPQPPEPQEQMHQAEPEQTSGMIVRKRKK